MAIAFTETHDCHQVGGVCNYTCCPLGVFEPVDVCPKTHRVVEMNTGNLVSKNGE